jgi:hypothetical protein
MKTANTGALRKNDMLGRAVGAVVVGAVAVGAVVDFEPAIVLFAAAVAGVLFVAGIDPFAGLVAELFCLSSRSKYQATAHIKHAIAKSRSVCFHPNQRTKYGDRREEKTFPAAAYIAIETIAAGWLASATYNPMTPFLTGT